MKRQRLIYLFMHMAVAVDDEICSSASSGQGMPHAVGSVMTMLLGIVPLPASQRRLGAGATEQ